MTAYDTVPSTDAQGPELHLIDGCVTTACNTRSDYWSNCAQNVIKLFFLRIWPLDVSTVHDQFYSGQLCI